MNLPTTIAASLAIAGSACAQSGFWLMGMPPGSTASYTLGLSQNGHLAGGTFDIPGGGPGFTWTPGGGREDFGLEPGMPHWTPVHAVSADATTVAGWASALPDTRAYRRVGSGPIENLGVLPGETRSFAWAVSGDGSVVVGHAEHSQFTEAFGQAFRWTQAGGMQGLGYTRPNGTFSRASGISRDGLTIVGDSQSGGPAGPREAFLWTQATGMQALPDLPGAPFIETKANAVSGGGSYIVGHAVDSGGWDRAVRWGPGGLENLGTLPGLPRSHAYAVSDDGSVVGGLSYSDVFHAFVWTLPTGMVPLSDYLLLHGVQAPVNYRLEEVRAISGDGLTFGGIARNLTTNVREGFVATIPSPPSLIVLMLAPCVSFRRRRSR